YPNNLQAHFEGTFSNAALGAMITFMGTTGTLYIDRGRYELTPEPGKGKTEALILGTNPARGQDFYDKPDGELLHLTNWVECVMSRKKPAAPGGGRGRAGAGGASGQRGAAQRHRGEVEGVKADSTQKNAHGIEVSSPPAPAADGTFRRWRCANTKRQQCCRR